MRNRKICPATHGRRTSTVNIQHSEERVDQASASNFQCGARRFASKCRRMGSAPLKTNIRVAGSGAHWTFMVEDAAACAAICADPKNDPITGVKFVPLIVNDVSVVGAPAVS